jgi:hypothetical protein
LLVRRKISNTLTIVLIVAITAAFIVTSVLRADSPDYVSGDGDGSGSTDIDDAVLLINHIFTGGSAPDPVESGDASRQYNYVRLVRDAM